MVSSDGVTLSAQREVRGPAAFPHGASEKIERLVARRFRVPLGLLQAAGRCTEAAALARHVAMYLERVLLEAGYEEIASRFTRHPTTVMYACRRIELLRDDPEFDRRIGAIESAVMACLGEGAI